MSSSRIYVVATNNGNRRLVRASHRSQAVNHVARTMMEAWVATQEDLVEMVSQGVQIESTRDSDTDDMFNKEVADEIAE